MRWFEGGIAEAVSITRQNGSIFVVYCEGNDTESERFTNFLNTEKVSSQLSTDKFVCIKIQAESTSHHQFTEIYKKVNAPSIFFIGKGGVPLEIVESIKDSDDILSRIERALQKSGVQFFNTIDLNSEFISTEQRKQVDESASATVKDGGASTSSPQQESTPMQQEQVVSDEAKKQEEIAKADRAAELSAKEKLEKAQQLIERTREAKKREEEEKERQRELERRKMGIEMQKQKRQKEDDEMKQLLEARNKEKKEQEAAKQRVLDQIQQDKADRAARFSNQNQQQPAASLPPQPSVQRTPPTSNVSRIQFKLPDGSAHTHEFPPATTLAEVRTYIRTNITLPFNQFLLATMFPRKEFQSEDDSKTLHELELFPSAVLLILPISHGAVTTHTDGSFGSMLWSWFAPLLNLLGYLKGMIFGAPRPPAGASPPESGKRPAESGGPSSRPLPKRKPGETTAVRRQGNIHRLSDQRDSDEDNNTWNGNSTQQM